MMLGFVGLYSNKLFDLRILASRLGSPVLEASASRIHHQHKLG